MIDWFQVPFAIRIRARIVASVRSLTKVTTGVTSARVRLDTMGLSVSGVRAKSTPVKLLDAVMYM